MRARATRERHSRRIKCWHLEAITHSDQPPPLLGILGTALGIPALSARILKGSMHQCTWPELKDLTGTGTEPSWNGGDS